ncbi:MAG TPA: GNAT family N-acetyltransferase, partial [Candidatus Limnocylindrales bacterium]
PPDAEIYHDPEWLAFLRESQGAEIVTAAVLANGQPVGYFVGGIVRRYGLRMLGSPMTGWGTPRLGFLLEPGADRRAAAEALLQFAFQDLGCVHVELGDAGLAGDALAGAGYGMEGGRTFLLDLARSEQEILEGMHERTRRYVRSGPGKGLVVEQARGEDFAAEFHAQLTQVFARQGLAPTYDEERVRQLIRHLEPSDKVLLLRVLDASGTCMATSISIGSHTREILWGAASLRAYSSVHPNEVLHWAAIRHWRSRGFVLFDFGGGGEYKAKYGGVETSSHRYVAYRYSLLRHGRAAVRGLVRRRQMAAGRRLNAVVEKP